jgi:hypothetical protein
MNLRIKYTLVEWMIVLTIILIVARIVFAPWIHEWLSRFDTGYIYIVTILFFAGAYIFKKWQKLYTVNFVWTKDKFETAIAGSDIKFSEDSVIFVARNKKNNQEFVLAVGEPEIKIRKDPTLKQFEEDYDIMFFNPFRPGEFSPKFADTVIHYYLERNLEKLKDDSQNFFQKLLFILHRVRFNLNAEIQEYELIENSQKIEFETLLSENLLVKSFAIKS